MSATPSEVLRKITPPSLLAKKSSGEKIVCLTANDYPLARILDDAGLDLLLVGDSLAMTRLPLLAGREIIKALERIGYREVRQRGSHVRLQCGDRNSVTVPMYSTVSHGLLRKILRDAELTSLEFQRLLR